MMQSDISHKGTLTYTSWGKNPPFPLKTVLHYYF